MHDKRKKYMIAFECHVKYAYAYDCYFYIYYSRFQCLTHRFVCQVVELVCPSLKWQVESSCLQFDEEDHNIKNAKLTKNTIPSNSNAKQCPMLFCNNQYPKSVCHVILIQILKRI